MPSSFSQKWGHSCSPISKSVLKSVLKFLTSTALNPEVTTVRDHKPRREKVSKSFYLVSAFVKYRFERFENSFRYIQLNPALSDLPVTEIHLQRKLYLGLQKSISLIFSLVIIKKNLPVTDENGWSLEIRWSGS